MIRSSARSATPSGAWSPAPGFDRNRGPKRVGELLLPILHELLLKRLRHQGGSVDQGRRGGRAA
jgi:hypothetical protein